MSGKVHGQRSLVGCGPWGYMTEHVHEGGGRWVGSNKLIELKKPKNKQTKPSTEAFYKDAREEKRGVGAQHLEWAEPYPC